MSCDPVQIMSVVCLEEELAFTLIFEKPFWRKGWVSSCIYFFDSWFTGKLLLQNVSGLGQRLFHLVISEMWTPRG